jgi:hypothetical protein
MFRWIFRPCWQGSVSSTQVEIHSECSLEWDGFCSTHVEVHFVSSQALDGFGQHMLIWIIFPGCHGRVLAWWDAFCVFAGFGWAWSIHVEMHFESWLSWEEFAQHIVLWRWHGWNGSAQVKMHFVSSRVLDEFG